ncbi:hypothetical protein DFH06DRAFT_283910 [Mycena polygramma]|nr:hypothetical protein DFH06DRAFT_283910 [Mycena polygramma]
MRRRRRRRRRLFHVVLAPEHGATHIMHSRGIRTICCRTRSRSSSPARRCVGMGLRGTWLRLAGMADVAPHAAVAVTDGEGREEGEGSANAARKLKEDKNLRLTHHRPVSYFTRALPRRPPPSTSLFQLQSIRIFLRLLRLPLVRLTSLHYFGGCGIECTCCTYSHLHDLLC